MPFSGRGASPATASSMRASHRLDAPMIALRMRSGSRAWRPRRRGMAWGGFSKALARPHSKMWQT
eukprot:9136036-Pyramimonas_sp.AAC.1